MIEKRRRGEEQTRRGSEHSPPYFGLLFLSVSFVCFVGNSAAQDLESIRSSIASGNAEMKRNALSQIRTLQTEAASRLAVPALSDTNLLVRATAASAVIFLPKTEAAQSLTPLLSDKVEFVRGEAAFALGEVGEAAATAPLIRALEKDRSLVVRAAAATALGKIGDVSAVAPLAETFHAKPTETNEFLRRCAAHAIGLIAETLRGQKRTTTTPENFLPDKYKQGFSQPAQANRVVIDQWPAFRLATATLVTVLQNPKESDDTRREAAFALGTIGDPTSIPALRLHLDAPDNYLAEICKEALLKLERLK